MFANLKNKLIEEVKASPSKFQQFANAAQAAVSSSSTPSSTDSTGTTATTTSENFFSITEEDTPQNSPTKPLKQQAGTIRGRSSTPQALNNGTGGGAIPRTRKLSNSSIASDVSFRLPSYESPAVYHLQSDWDASGSEMGDEPPPPSAAKLDVITKEQLFDAYKKSLERYNKYRCRYTDLAKKYKDLERDSSKARSVLVETQEKAIRRINELREQCSLEQQAKAHLDEALRMEIDDMQCKMQAYQTKLKLLGENPEKITAALNQASESLIDLETQNCSEQESISSSSPTTTIIEETTTTTIETTTTMGNGLPIKTSEATAVPVNKINELEKQLHDRERQIKELSEKLLNASANIETLKKQEEENSLLLAQTKQAIHSELENKEAEVKKLTETINQLQSDLRVSNEKHIQIYELTELKEKLLVTTSAKQEIEAKLIASEHMLAQLKEQSTLNEKSLQTTEENLAKFTQESEQKLQDLQQSNDQLNEMIQRYQQNEVSLAEIDNELNRTKNENDNLRTTISEHELKIQEIQQELSNRESTIETLNKDKQSSVDKLMKQLEEIKTDRDIQYQRTQQLESEKRILTDQNANDESQTVSTIKSEMQLLREQMTHKEKELRTANNKLEKQKKHHESQQTKMQQQSEELETLRSEMNRHAEHLEKLQQQARQREEIMEREKIDLQNQVTGILREITVMENQMDIVQQSHSMLEKEKQELEQKIENLQEQSQQITQGSQRWRDGHNEMEEKLRLTEAKLQHVETEHSQLAEKNCLLEENGQRLEKLRKESERQRLIDIDGVNEMRLKLETTEAALQSVNAKMSEILDENSRMQNSQELMDHDHRKLQDKCESLEKEVLIAKDAETQAKQQLEDAQSQCVNLETDLQTLRLELSTSLTKFEAEQKQATLAAEQMQMAEQNCTRMAEEVLTLKTQMETLLLTQSQDAADLRLSLQSKDERILELEKLQLAGNETNAIELQNLQTKFERQTETLQKSLEELELLRSQKESLIEELNESAKDLSSKIETNQTLTATNEELTKVTELLHLKEAEVISLQEKLILNTTAVREEIEAELKAIAKIEQQHSDEMLATLRPQLEQANADVERLHESNDAMQVEMDKLRNKQELEMQELQATLKQLQVDHEQLQERYRATAQHANQLANYEQVQLENEYLNKNVQQMEQQLKIETEKAIDQLREHNEMRDKFKSIQCEMYVLKENAEKHDVQFNEKVTEIENQRKQLDDLQASLHNERIEATRQLEHTAFITEQNDAVQKELLSTKQRLNDVEHKLELANVAVQNQKEASAINDAEILKLQMELKQNEELIATLKLQQQASEIVNDEENTVIVRREIQLSEKAAEPGRNSSMDGQPQQQQQQNLRELNETLQSELENLKHKSSQEIAGLQQEIEDLQNNSRQMMERMLELETLRAGLQAQKLFAPSNSTDANQKMLLKREASNPFDENSNEDDTSDGEGGNSSNKAELEAKLKNIMGEVQEVSNRNLFLEQKCENYLILEQSNERLKLQNAKLSRQLDETLVSMQHNEGVTANTEFEYLKNIMFQYFTGSANGNNETLVKVISAVLKFSPQQTQVALEKEHQRRSLINKIL